MIRLGEKLAFGHGAPGMAWLDANWSAEAAGAWSVGNTAELTVKLPEGAGKVFVELDIGPCVLPPLACEQELRVSLGRQVLAECRLGGPTTLRLELPRQAGRDRVTLLLHHPAPVCPRELGLNDDPRRLGFFLTRAQALRADPEPPPPGGPYALVRHLALGFGSDGPAGLEQGWGEPEAGHVWALGRRSTLFVAGAADGPHLLLLEVMPFLEPDAVPRQRVMIGADDRLLATVSLERRATLGVRLPPPAAGASGWRIGFDDIDTATERDFGKSADGRNRAFMLIAMWLIRAPELLPLPPAHGAAPPPGELVRGFESLGHLCDFGSVQRRLGGARLGLLHLAGIACHGLVRGLAESFWQLGRPDRIELHERPGDATAWFTERNYTITGPSGVPAGADAAPAVLQRMTRVLPFLRRQFLEDLAACEMIYLLRRPEVLLREEVEAVLAGLLLHGDATLLWLVQDATLQAGEVRRLGPRLLQGGLGCDGNDATEANWLAVLGKAWALAGR